MTLFIPVSNDTILYLYHQSLCEKFIIKKLNQHKLFPINILITAESIFQAIWTIATFPPQKNLKHQDQLDSHKRGILSLNKDRQKIRLLDENEKASYSCIYFATLQLPRIKFYWGYYDLKRAGMIWWRFNNL
jgi:hypothetical protein